MTTYRIKPLVWELVRDNDRGEWWAASTIFGSMHVRREPDGSCHWSYCFDEDYDEGQHPCGSVEQGKEAAEAYYRERLLPALESIAEGLRPGGEE